MSTPREEALAESAPASLEETPEGASLGSGLEPASDFPAGETPHSGTTAFWMNDTHTGMAPYIGAAVGLLQGPLYAEDKHWSTLIDYEMEVRQYFRKIGLELIVEREEGYAFLRQIELEETDEEHIPRLVRRVPLSFEVTLLLVLLREWLEEFEVDGQGAELTISGQAIKERIGLLLEGDTNQLRLQKNLEKYIRQVRELGFLHQVEEGRQLDESRFVVKRILKARITADQLTEIRERMREYLRS